MLPVAQNVGVIYTVEIANALGDTGVSRGTCGSIIQRKRATVLHPFVSAGGRCRRSGRSFAYPIGGGQISLSSSGSYLYINFAPEPATAVWLLAGALIFSGARRQKRF
jgi:hypothetical protein